jgi:hypothetical protein
MAWVVDAVEAAAQLPGYREAALSWAPPIANLDHGPIGALMGYDFHVTASGPKLIEVNTNAGGAFSMRPSPGINAPAAPTRICRIRFRLRKTSHRR